MKDYDENEIVEILRKEKIIAVVGISDKADRDSYRVAHYLHTHGFTIIPVNPRIEKWNGLKAYPSLLEVPGKIDVVDVFRKPEAVMPVAVEAVQRKASVLWLQEEVINEEAADYAKEHGLKVVMNRCMMKEHALMR